MNNEDLSLEFIKKRFKTEEELDYVCNAVFSKYLSIQDKIDYISSLGMITTDQIRIIFKISTQESQKFISSLLQEKIVIKISGNRYYVTKQVDFKNKLNNTFNIK